LVRMIHDLNRWIHDPYRIRFVALVSVSGSFGKEVCVLFKSGQICFRLDLTKT